MILGLWQGWAWLDQHTRATRGDLTIREDKNNNIGQPGDANYRGCAHIRWSCGTLPIVLMMKLWVDEWWFWLFSERWQQPKQCNFTHIDKTKAIYIWLILHVTYTMEFYTQCTIWHTLSMTKFDDDKDVDIGVYCWGRRGRRWECELWGVCQHDLQRGKWRNVSRRGFL